MAEREWIVRKPDEEALGRLLDAGCPDVLARLLAGRGITSPGQAREFLRCGETPGDPFLLKDMRVAVERIRGALEKGEKITVYGDYDVDGVTATALLSACLRGMGAQAEVYIPERESEGYGLNAGAVRAIAQAGTTLIVTVDTGISAFEEAGIAKELGIDLIITDHHEPRDAIPEAYAIINPKLPDAGYPFRELAGVGVALKLAVALTGDEEAAFQRFGALAALGTVADVVPLVGENRSIVHRGLALMRKTPHTGIAALLAAAGAQERELTARLLAFTVAPRINAAGRMESAYDAYRLLTETDAEKAAVCAQSLNESNRLRQETESRIFEEAVAQIGEEEPADPVLMVGGEGWHCGVIGIVASRLLERYGKPAVLVSFEGDVGRASCRSMEGYDIHAALMSCADLLERFGGHALAAGFTVRRENFSSVYEALQAFARELPALPKPRLQLECELAASEITLETARLCKRLEPMGAGNPEPLFYIKGAQVKGITPLKGGAHLRLQLFKDGVSFRAMLFGAEHADIRLSLGETVDLAASLDVNRFNGTESLTVIVRDARVSAVFTEGKVLYGLFRAGNLPPGAARAPEREDFAAVYRYLLAGGGQTQLRRAFGELVADRRELSYFKLLVILAVFRERGLIAFELSDDRLMYTIQRGIRINLGESELLRGFSAAPREITAAEGPHGGIRE